ncbi:MAG: ATP-binding protein, partial [Thermoguttaceae bacterium]
AFDSAESLDAVLLSVFEILGKAAEVDRVCLWKNHIDENHILRCSQILEWAPGVKPQQGERRTIDVAYHEAIPTWEATLAAGECINGLVRNMTLQEQAQLLPHAIVSILVAPIMFQDEFWGFIGFDDCRQERKWSGTEVSVLRSAGGFMASTIARQQLEKSLLQARDEAEQSSLAKSEFLATMSHEIRTPLNGVIGLSGLLLGTELSRKQHEYAQLIKVSGESLLFLINDILDFSKIEAGKLEVEQEDFDLLNTVESVLGMFASRAQAKHLAFGAEFAEGLPRIVQGDSGRVRQILLNLVGNAIKFTENGGVQVRVSPEWQPNKKRLSVYFEVIDTGIGIPEDKMDRLFKTFSQTDASSSRVYGGTGLGLAISMRLVKLMEGEIGVKSTFGTGSTFWFRLPFAYNDDIRACIQNKSLACDVQQSRTCVYTGGALCVGLSYPGKSDGFTLENIRVLIAGSNSVTREILAQQLSTWKMLVDEATSARESIDQLRSANRSGMPFEIVFVDETLYDCTGKELAEKLSSDTELELLGIAVLVPFGEELNHAEIDKLRIYHLTKPIYYSALFDTVMTLLYEQNWSDHVANRDELDSGIFSLQVQEQKQSDKEQKMQERAKQFRILVAEDNKINQIVVKNLLREAGFDCDIVINGREATDAAITEKYDLVLMDCQMPETDGYEAALLIRNWEREQGRKRLPIIALTANATKEDVDKCFTAGMDAYCSKPIDASKVIGEIHKWL